MTDKLIIFDTTMRDGEQSPGASMTRGEKMRIARALEKLRVDVIEAGFPIASGGDFEAVRSGGGNHQGKHGLRSCAYRLCGHRRGCGSAEAGAFRPYTHVYRHVPHPHGA